MCPPTAEVWRYAWIECVICGLRYVAVYCECPEKMECECGYWNDRPTEEVDADDPII